MKAMGILPEGLQSAFINCQSAQLKIAFDYRGVTAAKCLLGQSQPQNYCMGIEPATKWHINHRKLVTLQQRK